MDKLMGLLFLIGWVAGQIIRLPGDLPVTLLDVAVGVMVIAKIRLIRGIRGIRGICLILIASWIIGLRLFSWQESIPGGLYLLRFLGYLWVIANADKLLAPVKKYIAPALWIFVILAWVQYLFLPDTRFLLRYGWDEHYYRMIGTVLDPNYLGVMLGVIGIYLIYKYTNKQIDKWGKILLALTFGGLAMTYSRASWAAVMVVGCWLLVISGGFRGRLGKLGGLGILLLILIVWLIAPKPGGEGVNLFRTNSIEQRIESWKEGINVWREHPWIGVGFNNYGENAPSSSWILLLATTGVIGIGGLGVIGGIRGIRAISKNKLWVGILMMVGIHAVFNNTLFYPPVLGLLALIKAASED